MEWSGTFSPDSRSAALCRRQLVSWLRDAGSGPEVIDDIMILEAELVGNAIRHAGTQFTVSAAIAAGVVRLEVFDRDSRPPALMGVSPGSTGGRGLSIVAAVAVDWGWHTARDAAGVSGKVVWAELPHRADPDTPSPEGQHHDV